jgi:hypothetical protein
MKARSLAIAATVLSLSFNVAANAGPNDFFGSSIGGAADQAVGPGEQAPLNGSGSSASSGSVASGGGATSPSGPPAGDYTVDEKRVQKKYKDNCKRAQSLIKRGDEMARSGDDKVAKKGKVLKEIGEKALAELKSNNPFPELAAKDQKTH